MTRARRVVGATAGAIGSGAAALSLAAFFGSLWWALDLVANFRPQQAAALAFLGLVALLGDRRVAVGILAVAVANGLVVLPYLVGAGPPIRGDRVEVLAFNVGISNPNRTEVASWIRDEDPDVVFLFESSFEWEDALDRADLPLQPIVIVPRTRLSGVTVLVRPSLAPGAVDADLGGEAAAVSIVVDGERLEILGVHPPSPTTADRSARRNALLAAAGVWVRGRPGEVAVVGDLNATPWSAAHRMLRLAGGLEDSLRGRGLQPTWPDGWGVLAIPIDHALHTDGLATEHRRTGPAFGSAHRPVIVDLGRR